MKYDSARFSRALKVKRAERGWTQADLAKHSGLSPDVIHRYESEYNQPTVESVCKLAEAFNCSLDDLVGYAKSI